VVAASSFDSGAVGKESVKSIESHVRQELGKDSEVKRFQIAALSARVTVELVDLTAMGGRKWAVVVVATTRCVETGLLAPTSTSLQ
jgi:hypothetical protein